MLPSRNAGEVSDIGRYQLQEEKEMERADSEIVFRYWTETGQNRRPSRKYFRDMPTILTRQRFERELHHE